MKKGISIVSIVIAVIILIILAGIIIINTDSVFSDTSKVKLRTDISQLEALMRIYKTRKNGVINFNTVDFDTTTLSAEELEQFSGESIIDGKIKLYVIDLFEIDAEGVNYGNLKAGEKDRYLYSNITDKVYYEHGLPTNNITYYYMKDGE